MLTRERSAALVVVFLLLSTVGFAQTASLAVSPPQVYAFESVESFVRVTGSGLTGTASTTVVFQSTSVRAEIPPNLASSSSLDVWLPIPVAVNPGTYSVSVVATDLTGAQRTIGPATFTVVERPVVVTPDIILPEVVLGEAVSAAGSTVDFDPQLSCDHASGSFFPFGNTTVNCTFGSFTASFLVIVSDTTPPVISVPEDIQTDNAVVSYQVSARDNIDGVVTATCFPASGARFATGDTEVRCTANDSHANLGTASFHVNVASAQPPVLNLPDDFTTLADGPDGANVSYVATAAGGDISCSPASDSLFPLGTTTVQCSATNQYGTTNGSFKVTVVYTLTPDLSLPQDIVVEATGPTGAVVTFNATASSLADGLLAVFCSPSSGSTFPIGDTTVRCSAVDSHFNLVRSSFTITVRDTTPPDLSLPANITREATGPSGAAVSFSTSAVDLVDGNMSVTCSAASGATFPLGTSIVTCSATDSRLNQATGSFSITVVDTTPPALSLPANITKEATGPTGAAVTFIATSTDIVDGPVPVICSPASGSTFALGTTIVQCSATDAHLNRSASSFTVTVQDTTPPVITSVDASPREIIWPPNHKLIPIQVIVSATDLVDAHPFVHIVSVTSDQPEDCHCGDGDVAPDEVFATDGSLDIQLRAERTSGQDRHYTVTVAVTDFSGNTSQGTVVISVHP